MKKQLISLLLILTLALFACQEVKQTTTQTNTVQQTKTEADDSNGNAVVKIQNFAYEPEVITIKKGESVSWKNYDSAQHNVVSTTAPAGASIFESPLISKDKTFSQQFDIAGTYEYYCSLHPSMTGNVVVE